MPAQVEIASGVFPHLIGDGVNKTSQVWQLKPTSRNSLMRFMAPCGGYRSYRRVTHRHIVKVNGRTSTNGSQGWRWLGVWCTSCCHYRSLGRPWAFPYWLDSWCWNVHHIGLNWSWGCRSSWWWGGEHRVWRRRRKAHGDRGHYRRQRKVQLWGVWDGIHGMFQTCKVG